MSPVASKAIVTVSTPACGPAWMFVTICLMISPFASAEQADFRLLNQLTKIQADYCRQVWYPPMRSRMDDHPRWKTNAHKFSQLEAIDLRGVDDELAAIFTDAQAICAEVTEAQQKLEEAVKEATEDVSDPQLLLNRDQGIPQSIQALAPAASAELKVRNIESQAAKDYQLLDRRWNNRLLTLAQSDPKYQVFAADPVSCSPLCSLTGPTVAWTKQEIGTTAQTPYRLGQLSKAIEFDVTPVGAYSWIYYYSFSLTPSSTSLTPSSSKQPEWFSAQITSTSGLAQISVYQVIDTAKGPQLRQSNSTGTAEPNRPSMIQLPLATDGNYLLTVYHIHRPVFGPLWNETTVNVKTWLSDGASPPKDFEHRSINPDQQREWIEQQRLDVAEKQERLNQSVLATLASRPTFQGRYEEAGVVHPFTLSVQSYSQSSRAVSGQIDWPTYRGATRFRGQLVNTSNGWELQFSETDFVPDKRSDQLLLGGQYQLRPELIEDRMVFRGQCKLQNRTHPLIMQTLAIHEPNAQTQPASTSTVNGMQTGAPEPKSVASDISNPTPGNEQISISVPRPESVITHRSGEIHSFSDVTSYSGPPAIGFTADGKHLITTGGHLRAWDLARGIQTMDVDVACTSLAFPKRASIAFVGVNSSAGHGLFQVSLNARTTPFHLGELTRVTAMAVSHDGRSAVVCREPGSLVFYDLVKNVMKREINVNANIQKLCYTPDGAALLTADPANGIRIWNLRGEESLLGKCDLHGQTDEFFWMSSSPDSKRVMTIATAQGPRAEGTPLTLIIWERESLKELHAMSLGQQVKCVAVSPDWRYAIVGEESGEVGLWDIATGEELKRWGAHQAAVSAISFSPCWHFAATASQDNTVRVWGLDY